MKNLSRILLSAISSAYLTVGLLACLMLLVGYGTLYQALHGLFDAHQRIFDAWIVMLGGWIPFPGVRTVILILCVNLIAVALTRVGRLRNNLGLIGVHGGIAIMLIAAAGGGMMRTESVLTLGKGETGSLSADENGRTLALPFRCTLIDFSIKFHPGTTSPADYLSRVHLEGPSINRDVVISMNRPFRFRDYTLYQSSYRDAEAVPVSELAVVKNPLRGLPPVASIIIAAGLLLHFGIKLSGSTRDRNG
jgi:hypothetical protein